VVGTVAAPGRQGSQVTKVVRQVIRCKRQRSKGTRSFRGQIILKPGHSMHFFLKKADLPDKSLVRVVDVLARSFNLARPGDGVAPPLGRKTVNRCTCTSTTQNAF